MKRVTWKLVQALFSFQGIIYKKDAEEVNMLSWTNFDSFAITHLI